jgi:hypothetical protein
VQPGAGGRLGREQQVVLRHADLVEQLPPIGTPRLSPGQHQDLARPSGMPGADGRAASTLSTPAYVSAPVICRAIGSACRPT